MCGDTRMGGSRCRGLRGLLGYGASRGGVRVDIVIAVAVLVVLASVRMIRL